MIGGNRGYFAPIQDNRLAQLHSLVTHGWLLCVWYLAEIRPYFPIENMLLENIQRLFACVNSQWPITHHPDAVDHQRDTGNMIEVGVGNEHVINHGEFRQAEFTHPGACIDQHVMIKQERGGAQIATDSTTASQYSEFHLVHYILIVYRVIWPGTQTHRPNPHSVDFYGSR